MRFGSRRGTSVTRGKVLRIEVGEIDLSTISAMLWCECFREGDGQAAQ
jgi:hypothetical protein